MNIGQIQVKSERDIVTVRQAVKGLGASMGFEFLDSVRIATAASELTRNVLEHAGGGKIQFEVLDGRGLKMTFADKGKGIDDMDAVLSDDYVSEVGMGIGLKGARSLMDDFEIVSRPGHGTTVTVVKWLEPGKQLTTSRLKEIRKGLAVVSEESAIEQLKEQNRELAEVLNQLRDKNVQLESVNKELQVTNDGILSLYQEIDTKNEQLALESNRKTEFLRSFSHETRTPINSIVVMTRLLLKEEDGPLSGERQTQVNMIRKNADHLLNLVNDLLDLSRIESGIAEYQLSRFTVDNLFHHASATVAPLAEEKGLSLSFLPDQGLPEIESDLKMARQVMLNLLGNAIKFTDHGQITVTARGETIADDAAIRIEVQDTGMGIPEDKLATIFEQFQRVYSRDDIQRGSGLGLPIARQLAENLGGDISVVSQIDRGSTFSFTLPVLFPPDKRPLAMDETTTTPASTDADTILIVEDDPLAADRLDALFRGEGYRTAIARTAERAIRLATERPPPLAICLDLLLPREQDGWMVLKTLRRHPHTSDIPIVVTTVLDDAKDRAMALGATAYLNKPIEQDDILARIEAYTKSGGIETILVVDDEEAILMQLRSSLGERYTLHTARDGREAVRVLESVIPDLIILDLIMPVMDGFELLDRVRKDKRHRAVPILAYTSKELNGDEQATLAKNDVVVVNKYESRVEELPLQLRETVARLRKGEW